MVREIPLTQGYMALVDDEDYDRVSQFKWHARVQRHTVYVGRSVYSGGRHTVMYLHRFILDAPRGIEVDHTDGDGLNCRRSNLRLADRVLNNGNRAKTVRGSSPYKGVSLNACSGTWRAKIRFQGTNIGLGFFRDPIDAARAYDAAARMYFGEFARVNFAAEREQAA
jgi:hypothetical protein